MLKKGNKIKVMVSICLLLMFVLACNDKHEAKFDKSDVEYVEISKFSQRITYKSTIIYDKENISKLFDGYLNNSSEGFGKVLDNYRLRIQRNTGVSDTLFLNLDMYRSRKVGTKKMKEDATSFIEQLLRR